MASKNNSLPTKINLFLNLLTFCDGHDTRSCVLCKDYFQLLMPLIMFWLLAGFSDNKCFDRQGPLELKFFKIFIWIRGTLAKDTHLSIHTVYKFHNKMIMQVPWTFCEKNYLLSLALKHMTFQLMCSCQGINFLAGISISPINHSVPIGSQYPGGPSKGHKIPIIRVSFTYCAELPGPLLELKL